MTNLIGGYTGANVACVIDRGGGTAETGREGLGGAGPYAYYGR